jgi:hypothetical protein
MTGIGLRRPSVLPASAHSYFRELEAQYRVLPPRPDTSEARGLADQILARAAENALTIDDIRAFETALVALQDRPRVRAWGASLRERYAEFTGSAYDAPEADAASDADLRASVGQLLADVHRVTMLADSREEHRRTVFLNCGASLVVTCSVLAVVSAGFTLQMHPDLNALTVLPYLPLSAFVMLFGALGGAVSVMRRLSDPTVEDPLASKQALMVVRLAPVLGSVFALVLCMMFLGKLVEGPLFPHLQIEMPEDRWLLLGRFLGDLQPVEWGDFAKTLLWSFAAGFSERLVPDALSRAARLDGDSRGAVTAP